MQFHKGRSLSDRYRSAERYCRQGDLNGHSSFVFSGSVAAIVPEGTPVLTLYCTVREPDSHRCMFFVSKTLIDGHCSGTDIDDTVPTH